MAGNFHRADKDSLDISELASLNDDISDDFIDKLQQKLTEQLNPVTKTNVNEKDDSTLFEEVPKTEETPPTENSSDVKSEKSAVEQQELAVEKTENTNNEVNNVPPSAQSESSDEGQKSSKADKFELNQTFDDNFIKKYKAKLKSRASGAASDSNPATDDKNSTSGRSSLSKGNDDGQIEKLSQGKITERELSQEQLDYNDSLDFLDGNVKYSKYVIYIEPQNVDFIEGLTVKERKNLINSILSEQNDIAITKKRFKLIQTVIRQVIIIVLTFTISIPVVYFVINASLEATINNHRNAQYNWQVLYKEHGKITQH